MTARRVLGFELDRAILAVGLILGLSAIWGARHPLMIDLPQHAGQVALLRDLLRGHSPWAGELRINLLTPYLLGYAVTLPLSYFMSVATAMKLVLSLSLFSFVGFGVLLRKELGASSRLDIYLAVSFFGLVYGWGLYTFLVAAPLVMAFLWLAVRYARHRGVRRGLGLAVLGTALLWCHGLAFVFAVGCGGLVLLGTARDPRDFIGVVWPYFVIGLSLGAYVLSQREVGAQNLEGVGLHWDSLTVRAQTLITGFAGPSFSPGRTWVFLILVLAPFAMGLRIEWGRRESVIIAAAVALVSLVGPSDAWATNLIYERLTLFLFPVYALMFSEPEARAPRSWPLRAGGTLAALTACFGVLTMHVVEAMRFGREQAGFDRVIAGLEPDQRALALIFDGQTNVAKLRDAYIHYALWYQAEKGGFVEFNFAWFHPEVVRYREIGPATVNADVTWRPADFDWAAHHGDRYRYLLVRGSPLAAAPVLAQALCQPTLVATDGKWLVYDTRLCLREQS